MHEPAFSFFQIGTISRWVRDANVNNKKIYILLDQRSVTKFIYFFIFSTVKFIDHSFAINQRAMAHTNCDKRFYVGFINLE